jgi:hypothetical protein
MSSRSEELKEGEEGDLANGSIPENPTAKVENGKIFSTDHFGKMIST